MTDLKKLLADVEPVLARAAAALVEMRRSGIDATRKDGYDVVTAADLASEKIVIEGLRALTPDAAILSEEAGAFAGKQDSRWIIDPLDGTVNFAAGLPLFSVTAAYQEKGETLLGATRAPLLPMEATYVRGLRADVNGVPVKVSPIKRLADAVVSVILTSHFSATEMKRTIAILDRLSTRTRGVRIIISGALEMSMVAAGQLDAFVSIKADAVSHAGAMPLVKAAGGRTTTLAGVESGVDDLEKISSNGHLHDELLEVLKGV